MSREAYVRYCWEIPGLEVVVGLEWREGENPTRLLEDVKHQVDQGTGAWSIQDDTALARSVEDVITRTWSDRAYFLEIGDGEYRWVQVYDPRGFIKERCPCVGATSKH